MAKKTQFQSDLEITRILPAVALPHNDAAVPIAKALLAGRINFIEITFRNQYAEEGIRQIKEANLPIYVGAGTVRSIAQAKKAVSAGASFLVAPGYNSDLVEWSAEHKIPIFPGVDSTEGIEKADKQGLKSLKLFPASAVGGIKWLKAVRGPYFDFTFVPAGGVSLENLEEYLSQPNVLAVSGSFLTPKDAMKNGDYEKITENCKRALETVKRVSQRQ